MGEHYSSLGYWLVPSLSSMGYLMLWGMFTYPIWIKKSKQTTLLGKVLEVFMHLWYWFGMYGWFFRPEWISWPDA